MGRWLGISGGAIVASAQGGYPEAGMTGISMVRAGAAYVFCLAGGCLPEDVDPNDLDETSAPTVTVHGDPMLKVNGTGRHFWIKPGTLTPLLTVGDMMLSGKTFSRARVASQWFDEFVVSKKGIENSILAVSAANGEMHLELDGKTVLPSALSEKGVSSANGVELSASKLPVDIKANRSTVVVAAGDLAFHIYSSQAMKFAGSAERAQNEHLNIRFESGLPKGAKGVFAELAGVQPMSEATNALFQPPHRRPPGNDSTIEIAEKLLH